MTRFSQRIGASETPRRIQVDEVDEALRASLWNVLAPFFDGQGQYGTRWLEAARYLAHHLFKVPTDTVPGYDSAARAWVRERYFTADWYEVYDIVEMLAGNIDEICEPPGTAYYRNQQGTLVRQLNEVLERELSGYRFIRGQLVPVTDPAEIAAIEEAASTSSTTGMEGAHAHISAALRLLGQKPEPDYRNSIKESISAVECVVNVVTGSSGNGVSDALDELAEHTEIHGALRAGLKSLYGFASGSDGIRHAILDQATVGYDEAKFMLVACAAFVNFLAGKASEVGLL